MAIIVTFMRMCLHTISITISIAMQFVVGQPIRGDTAGLNIQYSH